MNIKEEFLKLTQWTIPFGYEEVVGSLLPSFFKRDKWGNYYHKVGESRTLFTCHLDTYSNKYQKVNHVIEGNIIRTDGTTILGGDNKAGVVTLLYMIEKGVPGFYYFFLGEEPLKSGGLWGSTQILSKKKFLSEFDRAVAFDRKMTGSIITRQMAQECCSNEFAEALIREFSNVGLNMRKDGTGYYTDTANFLEIIPECTNISIGVWNEHHLNEYVDISYVQRVAEAATLIDWEKLPTARIPKWWKPNDDTKETVIKKFDKFFNKQLDEKLFNIVYEVLSDLNYVLMTRENFVSGKNMFFNHWFEEKPIKVNITKGKIEINGKQIIANKALKKNIENMLK